MTETALAGVLGAMWTFLGMLNDAVDGKQKVVLPDFHSFCTSVVCSHTI